MKHFNLLNLCLIALFVLGACAPVVFEPHKEIKKVIVYPSDCVTNWECELARLDDNFYLAIGSENE